MGKQSTCLEEDCEVPGEGGANRAQERGARAKQWNNQWTGTQRLREEGDGSS